MIHTEELNTTYRTALDQESAWVRRYPRRVQSAIRLGVAAWPAAVQYAVDAGIRDRNSLTNLAFWMHVPELGGRKIPSGNRSTKKWSDLWLFLRTGVDEILRANSPGAPLHARPALSGQSVYRANVAILGVTPEERQELLRLRDLLAKALKGAKVDDRYWTFRKVQNFGVIRNPTPRQALVELKLRCPPSSSPHEIAKCVAQIHADITLHLSRLANAVISWAGDASNVRKTPECAHARSFLDLARRQSPQSVYSCFMPLLTRLNGFCRLPGR